MRLGTVQLARLLASSTVNHSCRCPTTRRSETLFREFTDPQPTAWSHQSPIPGRSFLPPLLPARPHPRFGVSLLHRVSQEGCIAHILGRSPLQGSAGAPDIHQPDALRRARPLWEGPSMTVGATHLSCHGHHSKRASAMPAPPSTFPTPQSRFPARCTDTHSG